MDIIHGDIQGRDILISDEGGALLCDLGLSKMKGSATSTCIRGPGSTFWMSPELLQEPPGPKTFESDVYAFGMTIAEASADYLAKTTILAYKHFSYIQILVGKAPFLALAAVLIENKRPAKEPKASPAGISYENTWEIADACWAKDPSSRISMANALRRLRGDGAW